MKKTWILPCVLVVISACSPDRPQNWAKTFPGLFVGVHQQFKEEMEFFENGTYQHRLYDGTNIVIKEGGKWTTTQGKYVVEVWPDSQGYFTEFFNPREKSFSTNGPKAAAYEFSTISSNQSVFAVTASSDEGYLLQRVPTH
jgi:hypothetical protein